MSEILQSQSNPLNGKALYINSMNNFLELSFKETLIEGLKDKL